VSTPGASLQPQPPPCDRDVRRGAVTGAVAGAVTGAVAGAVTGAVVLMCEVLAIGTAVRYIVRRQREMAEGSRSRTACRNAYFA